MFFFVAFFSMWDLSCIWNIDRALHLLINLMLNMRSIGQLSCNFISIRTLQWTARKFCFISKVILLLIMNVYYLTGIHIHSTFSDGFIEQRNSNVTLEIHKVRINKLSGWRSSLKLLFCKQLSGFSHCTWFTAKFGC